jgi:uncharacterized protein (TIGR03083 family)
MLGRPPDPTSLPLIAGCVSLHARTDGIGQSGEVDIAGAAPIDLRAAIDSERRALLKLLADLGPQDWLRPTAAGRWCVRDVALHLLDDDLGWLSRRRDGDLTSLIPMNVPYREFVQALDDKNQRWVDAAQGLSPRVVRELLAWSGEQVASYYDGLDAAGTTGVIWAGGDVPQWLGIGRDFTERWVHQQQIREAVGIPGDHSRYLPIVLAVFVWAFPNQFNPAADVGTTVDITLGEAQWHLVRRDDAWELNEGPGDAPVAAIEMDADTAWRQLTGATVRNGAVRITGPAHLAEPLLAVRGIIV